MYVSFGWEKNDHHPVFFFADKVTPLGPVLDLASASIPSSGGAAVDLRGARSGRAEGPKGPFAEL